VTVAAFEDASDGRRAIGLTLAIARDRGSAGIRVDTIAPGTMKTSIMESEVAAAPPPELRSLDGKLRAMDDFAKAFLAD
jgi:NAD(P)-dependent dehydrogenase (short-subunit alcohol dehydrogenase family)